MSNIKAGKAFALKHTKVLTKGAITNIFCRPIESQEEHKSLQYFYTNFERRSCTLNLKYTFGDPFPTFPQS